MKASIFAIPLAALALAGPVAAVPLKQVPAKLDPAKAYVLVEYKLQENPWGKFPGSRKTLPLQAGLMLARYDGTLGDIRGVGKATASAVDDDAKATEYFRNKPLAKGPGSRLFLLEVEPDLWVVQGFGNTSFSLGSYTFELAPGTVTDLGVVIAEPDWAEGQDAPDGGTILAAALAGPFAKSPDIAPMRLTFRPRGADDIAVPAGIDAAQVRTVRFGEGAKFGNYLGGLVNRIDGVNARLQAASETP
jgi:hypothetical protein